MLVYFSVSETLEPSDHGLHPQKLGAEINLSSFKFLGICHNNEEKMINFISDFSFPLQTSVPILGPSREAVYIPQSPKMPCCRDVLPLFHPPGAFLFPR